MAVLHETTMTPSKVELLAGWVPGRPWSGGRTPLERIASYRFDDPAGRVGLEGLLLSTADGTVLHVPLTYRDAPLPGADAHLVGTGEHGVLGRRWVYDGCADPVFVTALTTAILTGRAEAAQFRDLGDGTLVPQPSTATVRGSGSADTPVPALGKPTRQDDGTTTVITAGDVRLVVARIPGADLAARHTLTGRWGDAGPVPLAGVH